jgi:hypothetical protein
MPLSLCATSVALGQNAITPLLAPPDDATSPVALEPKEQHLNFVTLGFQLGFNIKTSFKNIGRFPAASNPGSTNGLSNHFYDDGYNLVDSTGNQHFNGSGFTEGTWNWGFGAGATTPNNGGPADSISMHSLSSAGGASNGRSDDPQPGFMLTFGRQLLQDDRDRWRAGLETSFGFTDYAVKDNHNVGARGNLVTDSYSLMGTVIPSSSSYSQDVNGDPNHIIIGDTPSRSITHPNIPVSGQREFEANLFAFKLGPYFEVPLNQTFSFSLEGGVAMVYVWSNFRFDEEVQTPGGLVEVKGNSNNRDIEFGGYAGAKISAAIREQWSLFVGAQWQDVSNYEHRDRGSGETAVIHLSNSIFFTAGIGYSF